MKNFDLRSFINENKLTNEAGPGFAHDCAAHVVHETYGDGICIEEQHTLVEAKDGSHKVTHYDVFFKNGSKLVADIPVEELKIVSESHHGHKKKKNEEDVKEDMGAGLIGSLLLMIGTIGVGKVLEKIKAKYPEEVASFVQTVGRAKDVRGF